MARKRSRQNLLWRLAKWCGFSSPLVIVVAIVGKMLGIDTSWFMETDAGQGRALIEAISKAAKDRDARPAVEPPARVVRSDYIGPMPQRRDEEFSWQPPPPAGITPPPPRSAAGDSKKVVDRRNDDFSFPPPSIRR